MAWLLVSAIDLSGSDTSRGSAGTTTGVPAWTDHNGNVWKVDAHRANGLVDSSGGTPGAIGRDLLLAPTGDEQITQRIVFRVKPGDDSPLGNHQLAGVLRYQAGTGFCYVANFNRTSSSAASILFRRITASANTGVTSAALSSYSDSETYEVDFSVTGASPTTVSITVTRVSDGAVVASINTTENTAGFQTAGNWAITIAGSATHQLYFTAAAAYKLAPALDAGNITQGIRTPTAVALSVTPTGGTTPYSYVWRQDGNIVWGATTATVTISGLTKGSTYSFTCTVTDADLSADVTDPLSVTLPNYLVIGASNSLGAGFSESSGQNPFVRMAAYLGAGAFEIRNTSQSGITTTGLITAATANVDPLLALAVAAGWDAVFVLLWEGTNDLVVNGASAAAAYANLVSYVSGRNAIDPALPIRWILPTILPRTTGVSGFEANRQTVNASLRSNARALGLTAIPEVGGMGPLGLVGQNLDTTYYAGDGIHWLDAASKIGSELFAQAVYGYLHSGEGIGGGGGALRGNAGMTGGIFG